MAVKDNIKNIEELFNSKKKGDVVTFENIAKEFKKQPTLVQVKKINKLAKDKKINIITASEYAKLMMSQSHKDALKQIIADINEEFDLNKEKELLEWSRSDSPVRMHLREMGKIPLLTKEEEIDLSKRIEEGEDIIIDAICSVPYLIGYILNYKEPLLNRERRVKELFKSFDEIEVENNNEREKEDVEEEEDVVKEKKLDRSDKRVKQVIDSFKVLEKQKQSGKRLLKI